MKILLVGSGGREHAIALKVKAAPTPVKLFAAPGSDAIQDLGTCLPLATDDVAGITAWAKENRPDLTIIGPESSLVAGLADALRACGLAVFGHDAATAKLEGSKSFAKAFMQRHGIPCAQGVTVTDLQQGEEHIRTDRKAHV